MRPPGRHPHFDDQHTAFWHSTLQDAQAAAAQSGRRVLLQVGRLRCGGSRALVEKTIPKEEIAAFLNQHFACVAADAEHLDAQVEALLHQVPRHESTPVCVYLDAGGRLLHATVGGRPAAVFLRDLAEAQAKP